MPGLADALALCIVAVADLFAAAVDFLELVLGVPGVSRGAVWRGLAGQVAVGVVDVACGLAVGALFGLGFASVGDCCCGKTAGKQQQRQQQAEVVDSCTLGSWIHGSIRISVCEA